MLTIGHSIASSVFCSKSEAPLQKAVLQQTFVLFLSIQAHLLKQPAVVVEKSNLKISGQARRRAITAFYILPHVSLVYFLVPDSYHVKKKMEKNSISFGQ